MSEKDNRGREMARLGDAENPDPFEAWDSESEWCSNDSKRFFAHGEIVAEDSVYRDTEEGGFMAVRDVWPESRRAFMWPVAKTDENRYELSHGIPRVVDWCGEGGRYLRVD